MPKLVGELSPRLRGVPGIAGRSLPERQFRWTQEIQSFEKEIDLANVNVNVFNAQVKKALMLLARGQFEFEQNVKIFEATLDSRRLANETATKLLEIKDKLSGSAWNSFVTVFNMLLEKGGDENAFGLIRGALSRVLTGKHVIPGPGRVSVR